MYTCSHFFGWMYSLFACTYVTCQIKFQYSVFSIHTHTAGFTSTAQLTSSVTATGWHKQRKHSMVYYRRAAQTYWLISQHRSTLAYCYAALLPRRGPHTASHSVCLSVCPSVPCLLTLEHRSRVFVNLGDVRYLLFCLHFRAAYRTAISAAQACW